MVVGVKEYQPSDAAKLEKLDEQTVRAKETRAALIKSIKEASEAAEKAEKEAEIAKQIKADNKAREKKSRALPEVGDPDIERLIKDDLLEELESIDSRLKKLLGIIAKFINFKNITQTDLIASITDIRTAANVNLSQQFVTCDIFNYRSHRLKATSATASTLSRRESVLSAPPPRLRRSPVAARVRGRRIKVTEWDCDKVNL